MAARKFRLCILTPTRKLYDEDVEMLIMRTVSGDIGILAGHTPVTTTLSQGFLRIINDGKELRASAFSGFAKVAPEGVTVLVDSAEWPDEIDKDRAVLAKERAERRIGDPDKYDLMRAEVALKRALIRIELSSFKGTGSGV